jgi:hypothetical protein
VLMTVPRMGYCCEALFIVGEFAVPWQPVIVASVVIATNSRTQDKRVRMIELSSGSWLQAPDGATAPIFHDKRSGGENLPGETCAERVLRGSICIER